MRGSSLKSPSQNRTCPIKAYGSSISHLPNKHLLHISSDTPMGVPLGFPYTFSMSASKIGLFSAYFSTVLLGHIYNTCVILCSCHRFHSICSVLSVLCSVLRLYLVYFHTCVPKSISLWLPFLSSAFSYWFYAAHNTFPNDWLHYDV